MTNDFGKHGKKFLKTAIFLLLCFVLAGGLFAAHAGSWKAYAQTASEETEEEQEDQRVYVNKTGVTQLDEETLSKKGRYADADSRLADMQLMAEEGKLKLYLDPDFAEFAVVDQESGESWFSNPYDFENDTLAASDAKLALQSLIRLTYYDESAKEGTMNSYSDCTSKDQYVIEKLENGFALHMQIGRPDEAMLVPSVVEVSKFEEKILPHVSDRDARRLNSYYTKVSLSDAKLSDSVKEGYLKNYPGLTEQDFYILRGVVDREKRQIDEILKKTEYTMEDLETDLAVSGYEEEEAAAALFEMSMYVELDEGDLVVTIPAQSIQYDKEKFYLARFQVLDYFGAGKSTDDGYLFVPDGSGALINYNRYGLKKILYTTNTVYGMDYALNFEYMLNSLSNQIYFPVYGNKDGERAVLGILEDGESLATVIGESGNIISSYETVYPEFHYATAYTANYTDDTKIKGLYTYHDTNTYQGNYRIRYRFLTGEDASYAGMARSYRDYLLGKGALTILPEEESQAVIYLETLGAIEKTSTFLGIPYVESVPLTTFAQDQELLETFRENGMDDVRLRLKGWENGGMYSTASNRVNVEKSLGGEKGLAALEGYAAENGMQIYPDADFLMVTSDEHFDGYSSSTHSARNIKRENLYLVPPQGLTNLAFLQYADYSISPRYLTSFMDRYFADYDKLAMRGVSSGTLGTMLYSEFNRKRAMNREEVKDAVTENLERHFAGKQVIMDGGNAYVLPYVSNLVNVPMTDSAYTLEDESVPFLQLVLHGCLHYGGEALNLSNNPKEQFLRSIEYGSNPFFTVSASDASLLKETSYTYYTSVNWEMLKDEILAYAREWKVAYDGLENQQIASHEKLEEGLYRTEYEDGTVFYVNYNDEELTLEDGTTVPAQEYLKTTAR